MYTLYKTTDCVYCPMVAKILDKFGKPYKTVDVTNDLETRKDLQAKTGAMSVPILLKEDGSFLVGYNLQQLIPFVRA